MIQLLFPQMTLEELKVAITRNATLAGEIVIILAIAWMACHVTICRQCNTSFMAMDISTIPVQAVLTIAMIQAEKPAIIVLDLTLINQKHSQLTLPVMLV